MSAYFIEFVAGKLYEHYCEGMGGFDHNGEPLPKWSEFSVDPSQKRQSDAWRFVAQKTAGESQIS